MNAGDIVKYMSRLLLLIDTTSDPDWAYAVELGENVVGRYRKTALRSLG